MGLIFNEKIAEKWNLWDCEQCTDTLFTEEKSKHAAQEKKKKGTENAQNVNVLCIQTAPK